ncbi:unnamed protein product [Periconia digitata]|uniref:Uncharacterized protein n=1 Tax=Periconia digitata TaxID=1303443 RepID=A0A9W4XJA7_9PLEO|nr:unnamed protein product [Periconia digitata]
MHHQMTQTVTREPQAVTRTMKAYLNDESVLAMDSTESVVDFSHFVVDDRNI